MEIKKVKADLHTHGFCGWSTGFGQSVMRLFGDSSERDLWAVSDRCFNEGVNTLIGFVNFNDTRYEGLVNTRKGILPKGYGIYDDYKESFIGVHNRFRDIWNFIMRGQEIPTEKGHVLVLGGDKNIEHRQFEDVIKSAKDMDALRIADHALAEFGLLGKVYDIVTGNHGRRLSLGKENLKRYAQDFDAMEVGNSNFHNLVEESEDVAKRLDLAKVYTSDSHNLSCMFSSNMVFGNLDFSSPEKLRGSLRERLRDNQYEKVAGRNRRFETLLHAGAVLYNIARQKIGLVKGEKVELN